MFSEAKNKNNDIFSLEPDNLKTDLKSNHSKESTLIDTQNHKKGKWTKEEDFVLQEAIEKYGSKNWKAISELVPGRSSVQCLHRWSKILKPGLVKGPWSVEQDRKLLEWINSEGSKHWNQCADYVGGRTGKQCRERWFNTLNPQIKKGEWNPEEDFIIFESYRTYGSQWTKIVKKLNNGRTENSIKNRFYSTLRRISAKKKNESWEMNCNLPFDKIIQYLPDAIMEKTISYINYLNEQQYKKDLFESNSTNPAQSEQSNYPQNILPESFEVNEKANIRFNQMRNHIYSEINQSNIIINSNESDMNNNVTEQQIESGIDKENEIVMSSALEKGNSIENNIKSILIKNDNNYYVGNNQLNNLIEKLLLNKNYKIEKCVGQSYYIDINKQKIDINCHNNNRAVNN